MVNIGLESDIRGGNSFTSPHGTTWSTILVKTGVHQTGDPVVKPTMITKDVYEAVEWAVQNENWPAKPTDG
jgi:ribonucleotide monophosphatase NagD (HAD superfamily)